MPRRRGHNEGSIFKDSRGRYHFTITVHDPDRTWRKDFTARTRKEVVERKERWEDERAAAAAGKRAPTDEPLAEYLERWLRDAVEGRTSVGTLTAYRQSVRRIGREIGDVRLSALTASAIAAAVSALLARLSPSTVRRDLLTLRAALDRAVKWKLIGENPAREVRPPRVERRAWPVLSPEELRRLFASTRQSRDRLYPVWVVLATSGLRLGEVLGLRWEDVDFATGELSVRGQVTLAGTAGIT